MRSKVCTLPIGLISSVASRSLCQASKSEKLRARKTKIAEAIQTDLCCPVSAPELESRSDDRVLDIRNQRRARGGGKVRSEVRLPLTARTHGFRGSKADLAAATASRSVRMKELEPQFETGFVNCARGPLKEYPCLFAHREFADDLYDNRSSACLRVSLI